jgi:hypothetical protein
MFESLRCGGSSRQSRFRNLTATLWVGLVGNGLRMIGSIYIHRAMWQPLNVVIKARDVLLGTGIFVDIGSTKFGDVGATFGIIRVIEVLNKSTISSDGSNCERKRTLIFR